MNSSLQETTPVETAIERSMRWMSSGGRYGRRLAWAFAAVALLYVACVAAFGTGPVNFYGNDALELLDGGWRILSGQIPYRDFYIPLGPLEYMIAAGGMWLTGCTPKGLSVGFAIAGACVAFWGWRVARVRMPLVPAMLATVWLALTATCPAPIDSAPNAVSCAMIYNRLGYALLAVLLLECAFAQQRNRFWGGVSSGAIVVLLLFLKLNFFGAAGLLLLVTLPSSKEQLKRWWGILAGAAVVFAVFCLYLRFALRAFYADMSLAIHSRGEALSFRKIESMLPGNGEAVTLLILTALTALLIGRGARRRSQEVRIVLLACAAVAVSGILRSTNGDELGLYLIPFWALILVAYLVAAFPGAKEKTAIAVLVAVGLGGITAQFYTDCIGMAALLKFRRPSVWSTGATITGYKMDGLRFFDNPDKFYRAADNGNLYALCVSNGVQMLRSASQQNETVATIGFHNPFSYVLRRKPALGGSTWLQLGSDLPWTNLPPPERFFGNADLIMEPHFESSHAASDMMIEKAYEPYLLEHYAQVSQSEWWTLYRRIK